MVANHKVTGKAMSMPAGICLGLGVSVLITLLGCGVMATLTSKETMPVTSVGYGVMLTLLLASALGALAAVTAIKHRRLVVCLVSGVCYFLTLIAITDLFFGGQYHGVVVTALVILAGCGTVALWGLKGEGNRKIKHRKYPSR